MNVDTKITSFIFYTILVYLCVLTALYFLQRKMIFYPDTTSPDITLFSTLGIENIEVKTTDGLNISGWWHKAKPNKPTILFFHGNAGHHGHRVYNTQNYIENGFGVLLAGYRGYGGNKGYPSESGFYEDARTYIKHLIKNGVAEQDIILYGQSIGSGVAVQMATEFPNVKALILEAPYTSLPDVAARQYFFIPVHFLMKDKFDNLSKIQNVTAPLLIIHGTKDKIIPATMSQTLFNTATSLNKEIYLLKNHGHNDLPFKTLSSKVISFTQTKKRTE